jgi:hypothetical protein
MREVDMGFSILDFRFSIGKTGGGWSGERVGETERERERDVGAENG